MSNKNVGGSDKDELDVYCVVVEFEYYYNENICVEFEIEIEYVFVEDLGSSKGELEVE